MRTESLDPPTEDVAKGTAFAELVDKITCLIESGEHERASALIDKHPNDAERLRRLLPTIEALAAFDGSLAGDATGALVTAPAKGSAVGLLGDFRILRELGRGGMGVVYEAEQVSLGRRVALKVLPFAAMLDRQQLARFKNEARAAATLDHPNIVAIYSVGVDRGVHYYAMQLIEGQSLAQVVEQIRREERGSRNEEKISPPPIAGEGPGEGAETAPIAHVPTQLAPRSSLLDPSCREYFRTIARLGIQAAEALDHAHQNGILHRDIKPANLLVECSHLAPQDENRSHLAPRDGTSHLKLWITDFGLARIEQDAGMTMTGDLLGTLRYMSPEQALAKRVFIDHRSDIYSLGVTLYELLTLQPAYAAEDRQELLRQIAFDEPRKPRQINPRIPQDLETIVLKAIEKNPSDRYATSQALADDLRRFLDDRPIKAKPLSLLATTRKWSLRHRHLLVATVVLMAMLTAGSLVSTMLLIWERDRTQQAVQQSNAVVDFLVKDLLTAHKDEIRFDREITVKDVLARAETRIEAALADEPLVEAKIRAVIAQSYQSLVIFDAAAQHARRAFNLRRELLGPAHPDTLEAADALVYALALQGKGAEARAIAEQLVDAVQREEGAESANTLAAMKNLVRAYVLDAQNLNSADFEHAVRLCRKTLALASRIKGPDHQETLGTKYDLGILYWKQGNSDHALLILEETLEASCKELGDRHRLSLGLMRVLPEVYAERGDLDQAARLLEKALPAHEQDLGKKHPQSLALMSFLGLVYANLGRHEDARPLLTESYNGCRETYGSGHPATRLSMRRIAVVLQSHKDVDECREIIAHLLEDMPEDEVIARNSLAWLLATLNVDELRDGKRAVELATQACELSGYKDLNMVDTLAAAYAEAGEFEAAIKWSQEAAKLANDDAAREVITKHLDNFKAGKPWRE